MKRFMRSTNQWLLALFLVAFVAGCGSDSNTPTPKPATATDLKAITTYSLDGATGLIDETGKTITVTMPFGTVMTALVATYTTTGEFVDVGPTAQTSASTPNNFNAAVAYTVTAVDKTTATYTATATAAGATDKAINTFTINGAPGVIDELAGTILVTVPTGTNITNQAATFTTTGSIVEVGIVEQVSSQTTNNFSTPVTYTVYDSNNISVDYIVTVALPVVPLAVNLRSAGNYVILAKSAVSAAGITAVTGDIGLSPAAETFVTGFTLTADASNTFATSPIVTGRIYAADNADPTPAVMTTAIADMQTAYTDAAGRSLPSYIDLGGGNISGMTLVAGLYKWGTGVLITNAGVTLSGGADDVWIFQIASNLTVDNDAIVTLIGAQAKNIFWQVAGEATLGTAVNFKGNILSQTLISANTGAVINGRALAQTAVNLIGTEITEPAP
jgi:hypothetical protein